MNDNTREEIQKHYDELFVGIFSDLSARLLETVQSATQQILGISANFLSHDVSDAIQDFHQLYVQNSGFEEHKKSIDKNVDDIIEFIQNNNSMDEDKVKKILDDIDSDQNVVSRSSLSNLHNDMEALAMLDEELKEHVVPILHGMQFEDQLSSNVEIITKSWKYFVDEIHSDKPFNPADLMQSVGKKLASVKLRNFFYKFVMCSSINLQEEQEVGVQCSNLSIEQSEEDLEFILSASKIQKFVDSLNKDHPQQDFLERMEEFCCEVLRWGNKGSETSVSGILNIIEVVKTQAQDIGDINETTKDAFDSLSDIAMGFNNPAKRESTKILISLMQNKLSVNEKIRDLIEPILMAMQFQDRVRQNMENLSKMMLVWLSFRQEVVNNSQGLSDKFKEEIGLTLIEKMTMDSEREIIKLHIPQIANYQIEESKDVDLF